MYMRKMVKGMMDVLAGIVLVAALAAWLIFGEFGLVLLIIATFMVLMGYIIEEKISDEKEES